LKINEGRIIDVRFIYTGCAGAGTSGSAITELAKGKGLEECGRLGNIVAQFSIAKIGARQGLPTLNELARRYRQLYNGHL